MPISSCHFNYWSVYAKVPSISRQSKELTTLRKL